MKGPIRYIRPLGQLERVLTGGLQYNDKILSERDNIGREGV